jgi:hypothetical protein
VASTVGECEAAGTPGAVGDQASECREGDLRRCTRADIEANRSMDSGDVGVGDAECAERGNMRRTMPERAHDTDPANRHRQNVGEEASKLGAVVIRATTSVLSSRIADFVLASMASACPRSASVTAAGSGSTSTVR